MTKAFTLLFPKDRPIQIRFAHMPGRKISSGTRDPEEAERIAQKMLERDGLQKEKTSTLADFAKDFFTRTDPSSLQAWDKAYNATERAPDYYVKRQAMLDNYILPAFGATLVDCITRIQIERWIVSLKGMKGELAADTKNHILWCLEVIMDDAVRHNLIAENPCKDVRRIVNRGNERRSLTLSEEVALFPDSMEKRLWIWGGEMWALYFSISYDTGFRPGEVAGLRVSDVYQTSSGLAVSTMQSVNSYTKEMQDRVKTTGKGLERRVGLLYDDTADLLRLYINRYRMGGDDLLFSIQGHVITTATSRKHFRLSYQRALGIPVPEGVVPYCIRHTYTTARRGEMPDEILANAMGHTKLRDDYDHRSEADMIRQLDSARDTFFENRKRRCERSDVRRLKSGS